MSNTSERILLFAMLWTCTLWLDGSQCLHAQIRFEDWHEAANLTHVHHCAGDQPWLPRLMVAGVAVFDYDNDDAPDILLLDQAPVAALAMPSAAEENPFGRLYRNRGNGTWDDVTRSAGLHHPAFALGAVAGDIDNDGDQDLAISCFGPSLLFINNGDGTFVQAAALEQPNSASQFGAGIAMLDVNRDGALDLFCGRYVEFTIAGFERSAPRSFPYPPGPKDFLPSTNLLYLNQGAGTWVNASEAAGLAQLAGPTMGIATGDWDQDGDSDLFLCSDAAANQLLTNDGQGRFEDTAIQSGVGYDLLGNANGSMGVDTGDYDNDGLLDLLISNYTGQTPVLYRNLGSGLFEDATRRTQIGRTLLPHTNWGVVWLDADNDADLDAFFANGHLLENIQQIDDRTQFQVRNTLMENVGQGRFRDVSSQAGPGMLIEHSSRGAASGDFDADGDTDLVVLNFGAAPSLLINQTQPPANWIDLHLVGRTSNRDGVGATILVEAGKVTRAFSVSAGRGYQSHFGSPIHVGLGASTTIDSVEIRWPSGIVDRRQNVAANQLMRLIEPESL